MANLPVRVRSKNRVSINNGSSLLLATLVSLSFTLGACSAKEQLDDMHTDTGDLLNHTKSVDKTSKELLGETHVMSKEMPQVVQESKLANQNMKVLQAQTAKLYSGSRQALTVDQRHKIFETLIERQAPGAKLSLAAQYFKAFEFQLWSGLASDTLEHRDNLATAAVVEFLQDVQEVLIEHPIVPRPFGKIIDVFAENNKIATLNALAGALSQTNLEQDELIKEQPSLKPMSMLTLFQEALAANNEMKATGKRLDSYPAYVAKILNYHQDILIGLLEVRMNYLPVMAIGRLSGIGSPSEMDQVLSFVRMGGLISYVPKWDLDLNKIDSAELEELTRYLRGAIRTRDILINAGETPQLDSTLKGMLAHIDIKADISTSSGVLASDLNSSASQAQIDQALRSEFVRYVKDLIK